MVFRERLDEECPGQCEDVVQDRAPSFADGKVAVRPKNRTIEAMRQLLKWRTISGGSLPLSMILIAQRTREPK
jgi:hypothetical protein